MPLTFSLSQLAPSLAMLPEAELQQPAPQSMLAQLTQGLKPDFPRLGQLPLPAASQQFTAPQVNYLDAARSLAQGASYDQKRRAEQFLFDCASFIGRSLAQAGYKVNPLMTTAMMPRELARAGFEQLPFAQDNLQPGDILWRNGHAEFYLGDGRSLGAHNARTGVGETNVFGQNGSNPYGYTHVFRRMAHPGGAIPAGPPLPEYVRPGFDVPQELEPIIAEAAQAYGVAPGLIKAVIKQESNFNRTLTSPAGAVGYMQLMPATAREAGVSDRLNPRQNIMGGTKYLRTMYDRFGSWPLALAAYNAGPNRASLRAGQIPNIQETRNYVRRVMTYWGMP